MADVESVCAQRTFVRDRSTSAVLEVQLLNIAVEGEEIMSAQIAPSNGGAGHHQESRQPDGRGTKANGRPVATRGRKAERFRELLASPQLEFILEAHNGISARIAEEAGFHGIWASGLALSAQYGVRDSNEASWTQVLEMVEFMSDATSVPILLDGDTGYGNFNNMRRLVRKLEQRGVAAVCIEDKVFPKTNSFINGSRQQLADVDEFCGKIRAGKDAALDDNFSIVARVEALIAGWGMREALRRAEAYRRAGADGILIHSAKRTADEVLAFQREWGGRCPLVIVPTKYCATPTKVFREAGFSLVIWANHLLRSAVSAMRESATLLVRDETAAPLEASIAPVHEIFALQRADELDSAEERYLPREKALPGAIILPRAEAAPASGVVATPAVARASKVNAGLREVIESYREAGIRDITLVGGPSEHGDMGDLRCVEPEANQRYTELAALACVLKSDAIEQHHLVVSYGDVVFRRDLIEGLNVSDEDFVIAVDAGRHERAERGRAPKFVECSQPCMRSSFRARTLLVSCQPDGRRSDGHGEWIGFLRVRAAAVPRMLATIEELISRSSGGQDSMSELLDQLVREGEQIRVVYMTGNWATVDGREDVRVSSCAGAP